MKTWKILFASGLLLVIGVVVLQAQGVQYIHRSSQKVNGCGSVWAYVGAWRDLRTGYTCNFDHDKSYSCWCRLFDHPFKIRHRCGYDGQWMGYTTQCIYYEDYLGNPDYLCTRAKIP